MVEEIIIISPYLLDFKSFYNSKNVRKKEAMHYVQRQTSFGFSLE